MHIHIIDISYYVSYYKGVMFALYTIEYTVFIT